MASRIMHMAVTKMIAEEMDRSDRNRLMLGGILPDFYAEGSTRKDSHLQIFLSGGQKATYHLSRYRKLFGSLMAEDALYLGYYLHLIQDLAHRDLLYRDLGYWNFHVSGNVERIHNDYHLLNSYLIEKYRLANDIVVPSDFSEERIHELCPFEVGQLHDDLEPDFIPYTDGGIFFFTKEMADSYIRKAYDLCRRELSALQSGRNDIDEHEWAWDKREVKSLLESTLNTRELGGYRTKQGSYTRSNTLIRSDEQKRLSKRDIAYLSGRNITTVIDMRGKEDVEKAPSPFAQMARFCYCNVPIEEGSGVPESTDAVPVSYMEIAGAANMNQVFKQIAHASEGVLFHCAAGKDRTGVVSAVLLLLAEVSDADIIENYMLTKEYNRKRFALARRNYPDIDINIIIPSEEYMARFLQLFREKYGSAEGYLRAIAVSPEETGLLKNKLLG